MRAYALGVVVAALVGPVLATPAHGAALGHITLFSAGLEDRSFPGVVVAGPDGNAWFTDPGYEEESGGEGSEPLGHGDPSIGQITADGKITEFTHGMPATADPLGVTAGPDGALWFTDAGDGHGDERASVTPVTAAIGRITTTGAITEFSTGLTTASLPTAITAASDGNLWFTDAAKHPAIGRATPAGQITEFATGLPKGSEPGDIVKGPDGNVWFTDVGASALGRITPAGQITEFPLGMKLDPNDASSITTGPDGNLWFTIGGTQNPFGPTPAGVIGRMTPTGTVTTFVAGLPISVNPLDITPGPDGALWFTDAGSAVPAIGRITTSGQVSEFAQGLLPGYDHEPVSITATPNGDLWFTDNGDGSTFGDHVGISIGRVDATGAATALVHPKFTITCGAKRHGRAVHCHSALVGPSTLAGGTPPTYQATLTESENDGSHERDITGTARQHGSRLVVTVTREYSQVPAGELTLTLTHGRTHRHVTVIVDCSHC